MSDKETCWDREAADALEARLRRRLRSIDPTGCAGNGTPLADAAATLLSAVVMQAGVGPDAADALTRAQLVAVMGTVEKALEGDDPEDEVIEGGGWRHMPMPFDATLYKYDPGHVIVGDQSYVLVDSMAGMIRRHEAPTDPAGPNLEQFLAELLRATSFRPCGAIGLPSVIVDVGTNVEHRLRFPACPSAGGVHLDIVLKRPINHLTHQAIWALVEEARRIMDLFWAKRGRFASLAKRTRASFASALAGAGPAADGLALAEVSARSCFTEDENGVVTLEAPRLHIGVASFDNMLRPGVCHYCVEFSGGVTSATERAVRFHAPRARLVSEGSTLRIDSLAAAFARAAPGGPAAVLRRLARELGTYVALPLKCGRMLVTRLSWCNGVITCEGRTLRAMKYSGSTFLLYNVVLSETLLHSLVGRRIDEFLKLPLPCPIEIESVDNSDPSVVELELRNEPQVVDLEAGTIADDPEVVGRSGDLEGP